MASKNQPLLNQEQQAAVEHIEGPLLILAGAGSGKTRIVTHRIAHLIEIGVPAAEILGLTFTNKAAGEMRRRVQSMTQQEVLTCTFHSLAARILRESIFHLGYKNDFTIYDADDSAQLLKHCLKSLELKEEKGLVRQLATAISNAKNDMITPQALPESGDKMGQLLKKIYICYQQKLKEYNALDFDDLLFLCVQLFEQFPLVREHYQKRWSFILIDEYQDTNQSQYQMIQYLAAGHRNLCVVGDPDQSIYSWRGANIHNILNFNKDYPDANVINLEQNYRSTNTILSASNTLIEKNSQRYEKNLWSNLGEGDRIGIYLAENDRAEAEHVYEHLIDHHRKDHVPLKEIVIFYRTNAQSRIFEDMLLKYDIPYVIVGGVSFYQRREIKDIMAYLRMLVSDSDFLSFARTINLPRRGIGQTTLTRLSEVAENTMTPIIPLCRNPPPQLKLTKKQQEGFKHYLATIDHLRGSSLPLHELIIDTIETTGYLRILEGDPETQEDRKANLNELIAKAADWAASQDAPTLQGFLEELSLASSADITPDGDAVQLMTLHNSKGLEFTTVFMVGMDEGLFPHMNSFDAPEDMEEERRLCYVGMTRAKRHLYLSAARYRYLWGTPRYMQPSRFLSEIPKEYVLDYSDIASVHTDFVEEEEEGFHPGTRVIHRDFGVGTVKNAYRTSHGLTYDVFFNDSQITRSLVAKYAKLKTH